MKHTNHYTHYLKLKEQADSIENMSVKARVLAQSNRELRKHQIINREITNAYQRKLEAKYANVEQTECNSECTIESVIVEDIIAEKPKRGRKSKKEQE